MLASKFFISTLKETPADAEIVSHQLMLRAGMIYKVAAGIYTYMPIGLLVLKKIEKIVRKAMDSIGAIELLMPMIQPAELWQETDRWEKMGQELLRFQDRHKRNFVMQPTCEEVITDIIRSNIKSYKQLPITFYQMQTKFRDERRPRFGVMRSREFLMKDAYSFDCDMAGLKKSYDAMFAAYHEIFNRLGLKFRSVIADNGAIGGSSSQEFHVIANTGEDQIVYCANSDYAANIEVAPALSQQKIRQEPKNKLSLTYTPKVTSCLQVAHFLDIPLKKILKAIIVKIGDDTAEISNTQILLLLLRADHTLNELKLAKLDIPGVDKFRLATEIEIKTIFCCPPGYLGPDLISKTAPSNIRIIADNSAVILSDFVCGANKVDYHYTGVNWERDLPLPETADLRYVVEGDPSPDDKTGKDILSVCRGIEVGHVFMLGASYSKKMGAMFIDDGGVLQPLVMGCYGIGVSRILGAAIEQLHDNKGIIWPVAIAPFSCVICPIDFARVGAVRDAANILYKIFLAAGIDVILDDRSERAGAMFADWELIGIPHRLTISARTLTQESIEYQDRTKENSEIWPFTEVLERFQSKIDAGKIN